MKKLFIAVGLVLATTGVVYAGCWTTPNFNGSVDPAHAQRLILQCHALRVGGSWTIASNGTSATKNGVQYTTSLSCSGSDCAVAVYLNGSRQMSGYYNGSPAAMSATYHPASEAGTCSVYWQAGNVILDNPGGPTFTPKVKYCR